MMTDGRTLRAAAAIALVAASCVRGVRLQADHERPAEAVLRQAQDGPEPSRRAGRYDDSGNALSLHATIVGLPAEASAKAGATVGALTITLSRWSTDAERAPLLATLSAPPPAPARAAAPPAAAGGRAGGRGRGAPPPPPPSPFARLSAAIKAAPTLGYIWTDGVTGYSIKYAWRSAGTGEKERIVLVTDRRLNSHAPEWPAASGAVGDAEFTVIEMRIDGQGTGEGKTSLTTKIAIDTDAKTLALDGYATAPAFLKVTR